MSKTCHHLLVRPSLFFKLAVISRPVVPLGSGLPVHCKSEAKWPQSSEFFLQGPETHGFGATMSQVTPCPATSSAQCRKRNGWLQPPSSPDVTGWWPLLSVTTNVPFLTVTSNCISSLPGLPRGLMAAHNIKGQYPFSCAHIAVLKGGKFPPSTRQASFCVKVLQQNPDFDLDLFQQGSYGKENMAQFNCLKRLGLTSCNPCLRK